MSRVVREGERPCFVPRGTNDSTTSSSFAGAPPPAGRLRSCFHRPLDRFTIAPTKVTMPSGRIRHPAGVAPHQRRQVTAPGQQHARPHQDARAARQAPRRVGNENEPQQHDCSDALQGDGSHPQAADQGDLPVPDEAERCTHQTCQHRRGDPVRELWLIRLLPSLRSDAFMPPNPAM
jgi:hypothetical protein